MFPKLCILFLQFICVLYINEYNILFLSHYSWKCTDGFFFSCFTDPNIPETGKQLQNSAYGPDSCCYYYSEEESPPILRHTCDDTALSGVDVEKTNLTNLYVSRGSLSNRHIHCWKYLLVLQSLLLCLVRTLPLFCFQYT